MPLRPPTSTHRHSGAPRWQRWAIVGLLTLLLHWIALLWADRQIGGGENLHQEPVVIQTALYVPPTVPIPTPARPAPPKPQKRSRPKPAAVAAPHVAAASAMPAPDAGSISPPAMAEEFPMPAATQEQASPQVAETKPDDGKPADDMHYHAAPPPSAQLRYDVQALREGQTVYGNGKIDWHFDGNNYSVRGEAGVLFFTVLSFTSGGQTDEFGIAPVKYTEKRFRKSETATHFTRERNTISFSASTTSYPLKGGEQDRASLIWQLASIGRGDREKFSANAQIPIFVAGARDGEVWMLQVIGEESINTGIGQLSAWHLVRIPRPGSYEQKLDIWFAPQRDWYPVRLRYTEVNGDYLDLVLSSIAAP